MKTQQTNISEVRLIYRTKVRASDRLQVKCSKDAFNIFMENWDLDSVEHIEEFKLLLMNRSIYVKPATEANIIKSNFLFKNISHSEISGDLVHYK